MNIKQRVLTKLKPKSKQFGFTKKVSKSVAAQIADKLDIDEDASDEDIDAKIDEAIEAALPYFSLIQSQANAMHDEWKKKQEKDDDDDEADDDDDTSDDDDVKPNRRNSNINRPNRSKKNDKKGDDDEPAWFKKFREEQEEKFAALKGEKIADSRRAKLEKLLKGTGTFGNRIQKSFDRMNFKDDDEFDEFYAEVEEDLKALNQERANEKLAPLGNPPGGKGGDKPEKKEEAFSDDEIDAMAD